MSSLREHLEKYAPAPSTQDITAKRNILKISLHDSAILEIDDEKHETLRMGFDIQDRQTRLVHELECKFPSLGMWDSYTQDIANYLYVLSEYGGIPYIPDNIEELADEKKMNEFYQVAAKSFLITQFRGKIFRIFYKYFDPYIEPFSRIKEKGKRYTELERFLNANMGMDEAFKIFTIILYVRDYLKKKSIFHLRKAYEIQVQLQSSPTLPKKRVTPPPNSNSGPSLGPIVFS